MCVPVPVCVCMLVGVKKRRTFVKKKSWTHHPNKTQKGAAIARAASAASTAASSYGDKSSSNLADRYGLPPLFLDGTSLCQLQPEDVGGAGMSKCHSNRVSLFVNHTQIAGEGSQEAAADGVGGWGAPAYKGKRSKALAASSASASALAAAAAKCALCSRKFISKHALRIHLTRNIKCRRKVCIIRTIAVYYRHACIIKHHHLAHVYMYMSVRMCAYILVLSARKRSQNAHELEDAPEKCQREAAR
jgi:hypothetical protein